MSTVHIINHNESIYAIGERIDEAPEELIEKKYKSRYSAFIRNEKTRSKTFKEKATMGPVKVQCPQPEEFLKKRHGRQSVSLENVSYNKFSCSLSAKRPDVPLKNVIIEQDEKMKRKNKNFILRNIEEVDKIKHLRRKNFIVVGVDGKKVEIGDGLQPKYIFNKNFGRVPKYIKDFEKEKESSRCGGDFIPESFKCIDRDKVLKDLKESWTYLQKEFQKLPLLIDTIPKIIRKQKLESLISQLEKDILLLEKHSKIYVYDDSKNN